MTSTDSTPSGGASMPAPEPAEAAVRRGGRGPRLTIRLKLTLWYGSLFLLAGVLLIAVNYLLVRDSLAVAPEKARAEVAERYGLDPEDLEPEHASHAPIPFWGPFPEPRVEVEINGVPVTRLIQETQAELKQEALRQLWTWSLVALAIMTVITFGSAWFLAGRMLRPLHAITATARRLSGSTLHERIALRGPRDELKELADTFDGMLGRLDAAFSAQREFVANASHELRTPLTIIRTEIDVALSDPDVSRAELQEMGAAVTEAVDRSEDLIDGLLVLASADRVPTLVQLDLAEIAQGEVDRASGEADAQRLRLELDLRPAPIRGERSLIERMVANLVENAVRHNTPDGWFSVKTKTDGALAVIQVANSGPVVPAEEVDRLFERFYRPDKSRSRKTGGFGLGLSIVKSVAAAHQGSVDLTAPAEGGLCATVSLPLATPPGPPDAGPTAAG
jgi:signal transduction histidine kinase